MKKQCPDCRTVTGGAATYCASCGFRFRRLDPVRAMAARPKKYYGAAAFAGFAVAVVQYMLFH